MQPRNTEHQRRDASSAAILEQILVVSRSLISVLDIHSLLSMIAKSAGDVLGADTVVLYEYSQEKGDVVIPPVIWGRLLHPEVVLQRGVVRPHRESAVFKILETQSSSPFFASDIRDDWAELLGRWHREEGQLGDFSQREDIVSSAAIPLVAGNETVGVLFANFRSRHTFPEKEREIFEIFAAQAAIAIHNARLFQRERRHAAAMSLLQEIGTQINISLSVDEILASILGGAIRLLDMQSGAIHLLDVAGQTIAYSCEIPAGFGHPSTRFTSKAGLTWRIVDTGQAVIGSDIRHDTRFEPAMIEKGVVAIIGVPFIAGDKVIGVLYLNDIHPHMFTEYEKALLTTLAGQAVTAINAARLFEEGRRRIRELEAVNTVSQMIGTKLLSSDILTTIASQISELLNCAHCTVFILETRDDVSGLVPYVSHGGDKVMLRRFQPGEGLAGWVLEHGRSLVLGDARQDPRYVPGIEPRDQPRSMLVAPIRVGDQTIGVISADQNGPDWFSEMDRHLVDTLALQAGIAIQRAMGLELLQDISNRVIAMQSVGDILQQVVLGAITLTNTTTGVIYVIGEDGHSVSAQYHPPGFSHPPPRMNRKNGVARRVLDTGDVVVVPDTSRNRRVNRVLARRFGSMVAVPLRSEQGVMGVLILYDTERREFTETEVSLLLTLATQAAIAIENARLYEGAERRAIENALLYANAERRARHLQVLREVASQFSTSLHRQEILRTAVDTACTTLRTDCCTIFLLRDDGLLVPRAESGLPGEMCERHWQMGEGLVGWVAQEGNPLLVADVAEDKRFAPSTAEEQRGLGGSMALAPLWIEGEVAGVISAAHAQQGAFDEDDLLFLETLSVQTGIALHQQSQRQRRVEAVGQRFNPYVVGEPVRDPQGFFGRRDTIQHIINSIHNNNFIIFGERRIGKTSVLHQLGHHLATASREIDSWYFLPVLASLQGVPQARFFRFLIIQIARAAAIPEEDLLVGMGKEYDYFDFEDDVETVVRLLQEKLSNREVRVVLLLDEMDQFVGYDQEVHEGFRSVFMSRSGHLKMVIAGVSVQRVARARTSPWYNMAQEIELQPLGEAAARQLVVEPVLGYYTYDNDAVLAILDYSDLKPQAIQRLSSLAVDAMLDRLNPAAQEVTQEIATEETVILKEDVSVAVGFALRDKGGEYSELWGRLRSDQRQSLLDAASADGWIDPTATLADGTRLFPREDLYNITHRLGEQVRLIYLFREWLRRQHP